MNKIERTYLNILENEKLNQIKKICKDLSTFDFKIIDYSINKPIEGDDSIFIKKYQFQRPEDTLKFRCGTCWDIATAAKSELAKIGISSICIYYESDEQAKFPANHMFLVIPLGGKFYSFEASWSKYIGVSGPYVDLNEILYRYAERQTQSIDTIKSIDFFIVEKFPEFHSNVDEFMKFIKENNEKIYSYSKYEADNAMMSGLK